MWPVGADKVNLIGPECVHIVVNDQGPGTILDPRSIEFHYAGAGEDKKKG